MKLVFIAQFLLPLFMTAQSMRHLPDRSPLMQMVESERAFAKTSLERGARASFMEYFDDSAMVFRPRPVYYKEAMKNVPPLPNPHESSLVWEPIVADIARSGDFGYTSGPSEWIDHSPAKRPPYYGFYFSVWKKHPVRGWKVVFDVGTELPGSFSGRRTFQAVPPVRRTGMIPPASYAGNHRSLMLADGRFLEARLAKGVTPALDAFLDEDARVYRERHEPIVGRTTIHSYFTKAPYLSLWKEINGDVAASGDLGYVYGSYETNSGSANSLDRGYYLRVWRRDALNQWKIVAEVLSPLPEEKPTQKQ